MRVQRARVDAGHAVDDGVADSAADVGLRGREQIDVAAGRQRDRVTLEQPGQVVDVIAGGQVDGFALHGADRIAHVFRFHDQRVARADGAAVGHVAGRRYVGIASGYQGAIAAQVARLDGQIDLRRQDLLLCAIGQGDGLLDQPHDVAGQVAHLLFGQRGAYGQAVLACKVRARGQQRLVLRFVVGVVAHEALAGSQHDLFGHQLLFIEAVA
ncbi:hypothetical protein D3C87_1436670 [compost metagenome]